MKKICAMVVMMIACGASAQTAPTTNLSDASLLQAAQEEIQSSTAAGGTDTQCSDFVAKVLRRAGVNVSGFRANDFNTVMAKTLPNWTLEEFTTADLNQGRADLQKYLNSFSDETMFLAQWPRDAQSGHVAIIEKIATDQFMIYQAQAGLSLPHSEPAKIASILYGTLPVERSHIRLYSLLPSPLAQP